MGHASVILGSDDDQEIIDALNLLANVCTHLLLCIASHLIVGVRN